MARRRMLLGLVWVGLVAHGQLAGGQTPTFSALEAGIDAWYLQASFTCDYQIAGAEANSLSDALQGVFLPGTEKPERYGVCRKMGPWLRQSEFWTQPARALPGGLVLYASVEGIALGDLELTYLPETLGTPARVVISNRPVEGLTSFAALSSPGSLVSPLNITASSRAHPLHLLGAAVELESAPVVRQDQDGQVQVSMERRFEAGFTKVVVYVQTGLPLPVVTRCEFYSRPLEDGEDQLTAVVECTEFVDCHGVQIPRRITSAFPPGRLIEGRSTWSCQIWTAANLGQREPTDEDFVFDVPPGVNVEGIVKTSRSYWPRRMDLAQLAHGELRRAPPYLATMSRAAAWFRVFALVAGIAAICGFWTWRLWRPARTR